MIDYFPKAQSYLDSLGMTFSDSLDNKTHELLNDEAAYERASQALRRRFVRGSYDVEAIDRGSRLTRIKREKLGGKYHYLVQGTNNAWFEPEERIWTVAMYALWQDNK